MPPLAAGADEEAAAAETPTPPPPLPGVGRFGLPSTIAANRGERASSAVKVSASGARECSSWHAGSEQEEEEDAAVVEVEREGAEEAGAAKLVPADAG